jgi:hypothetical protein
MSVSNFVPLAHRKKACPCGGHAFWTRPFKILWFRGYVFTCKSCSKYFIRLIK